MIFFELFHNDVSINLTDSHILLWGHGLQRLNETLRLYPPIPVNIREAIEDDVWPDGTIVRKGTSISWSAYSQARCSEIWGSDCKGFKPERWILDNDKLYKPESGEWNVFNIGPRSCLGMKYLSNY